MQVKIGQIWEIEYKGNKHMAKIHVFKDNHILALEYDSKTPNLFHINEDSLIELLEDAS